MRFERYDGDHSYVFVAVDGQKVTLVNAYGCEFEVDLQVLLAGYKPVLDEGEYWPEGLHHPELLEQAGSSASLRHSDDSQ